MSIPNKQIGWSNESNLLWQIAKQLERLTGVTSKISGGGGGSATVVTKAEVDALIASNSLVPGGTYIITGVDVPLYGGTTIMLQAETTNKLTLAGHGIFYNPKYLNSQLTPYNGYGIWSNYMYPTFLNIVGTFYKFDTVTANNGATATYLAQGFLSWISGDWSLATSIDNGSGATADVSGGVSPSYAIGQDVIWGGKHWTNTSGNVGTATDKYTLSSADWTPIAFNSTDYNVEIDVIHYDYIHDMIIRRKDRWDNDVDGNFQVFDEFANPILFGYGNPIKDFQWGNYPDDWNTGGYNYLGVISNYVKDSYLECINFIGLYLWNNRLESYSFISNNRLSSDCFISNNTLTNNSFVDDNTLTNNSYISYNTLTDNSDINNNALTNNSEISYNTLTDNSDISSNTLIYYSYIFSNTLTSDISIYRNTLTNNSSVEFNTLEISVSIYDNTLSYSSINYNTFENSFVSYNTLTNSCYIQNNTLTSGGISHNTLSNNSFVDYNALTNSSIDYNILTNNSNITNNTLIISTFNFSASGTLTNKTIGYIEANYANASFNISAATIIYGNYSKQMFRNSAGATQLGYYNASNVFTVVNLNA